MCKRKKWKKKKKEEREKEKSWSWRELNWEPLNRCAKQRCDEGTMSCIWKLGTSIENRVSMPQV